VWVICDLKLTVNHAELEAGATGVRLFSKGDVMGASETLEVKWV
jgi:hypothetical protein